MTATMATTSSRNHHEIGCPGQLPTHSLMAEVKTSAREERRVPRRSVCEGEGVIRMVASVFEERVRDAEREARTALKNFVDGAAAGDPRQMFSAFSSLDYGEHDGGGWRRAFARVSRLRSVPDVTRQFFRKVYLDYGDHIRQETGDDLVFTDGLRALLPPYKGPAIRLYRGETAHNRRHRTYGLSWTALEDVARSYAATGFHRTSKGGSVLLSTLARSRAIIHAVETDGDRYQEREYIVDRRDLGRVEVVERFDQLTPNELEAERARILAEDGSDPERNLVIL